jgi:hemolysin D
MPLSKLRLVGASGRGRDEMEFLPAALEVIETPVSPVGRWIGGVIIGTVSFALIWACVGHVDIIATAQGRLVPIGKSKTVQPLETSVVAHILVADGDHVEAGQAVIELDPTVAQADRRRYAHELMEARLDRARLAALKMMIDQGGGTTVLQLVDPPVDASPSEIAATAAAMHAQASEQAAKLASLDEQIAQKEGEIAENVASQAKIDATMPIVAQQEDIRRQAMQIQFGNKLAWLEVREKLTGQIQDRLVLVKHQEQAAAAERSLRQQRDQAMSEFAKTVLSDLEKAEQQVAEATEELAKANEKLALQTLRAPITGTVQELAAHSVGGVVTAAQPVLTVVPDHPGLIAEAKLENKDVGFVHPGQDVELKIEAFTFTHYGLIHGRVIGLSHDVVDDQKAPKAPQKTDDSSTDEQKDAPGYVVRVALDQDRIMTESGASMLEPGMAVGAEIKTGRRLAIDYAFSPVKRTLHNSIGDR